MENGTKHEYWKDNIQLAEKCLKIYVLASLAIRLKCKLKLSSDCILPQWEWLKTKIPMLANAANDVKEKEHLFIDGHNANWYSQQKSVWRSLKKLETDYITWSIYTTVRHIIKQLYILLKRYLLIHIHNTWKDKQPSADV